MLKKILLFLCLAAPLCAAPASFIDKDQNLVINNRVLLKVNGKPISVMDVVRKMDLIFYRQFPDLASSSIARYQFFSSGWEAMLKAVIDDQLIMADAAEKGVEITEGEVREELEVLFGPDVVFNLDKLGLTLSEAFDLLKTELTVQRMNMIMVRSKAMTEVYPKKVRERYEEMVKANPPQNQWVYRVLSVRGEEHEKVAQEAYRLLNEQSLPFEEVVTKIEAPTVELSLSDDYEREEKMLSLAHRAILQTLSAGAFSAPLSSDSVSRIFFLKEFNVVGPESFNAVAEKLKQELTQEIAEEHNEAYRTKLREHYGVTEKYLNHMIPDNFQPFALR